MRKTNISSVQFSSVTQSSPFWPHGQKHARPTCLSPTSNSQLTLMSIELVMPSNYLRLCHPLLLPSIFPSNRIFWNESVFHIRWQKYWSFSFSIIPPNVHSGFSLWPRFDPWVGKTLWRRKWQSTPVLLPGKSHGRRSLVGYSPWGRRESDTTERLKLSLSRTHSDVQSFLYADLNLPIENHLFVLINSVSPVSSDLSRLYFYNLYVFVYTPYH